MQKVVVPLLQDHYGFDPFFYLMTQLKDRLHFIVLTCDIQIIEKCHKYGLDVFNIEPVSTPPSLWYRRLVRLGIFRLVEEIRKQRHWAAQARRVAQCVKPHAALLPNDQDGFYFHLTRVSNLNSVIPQITLDILEVDVLIEYFRFDTGHIVEGGGAKKIATFFFNNLGINLLPRLGPEVYFPHGKDLWRTFGFLLGGGRYNVARKGGAFGKHLCVNGPHYRTSFSQAGVPTKKIIVTGSPMDDRLVEASQSFCETDVTQFKSQFNVSAHHHVVSFFLQPSVSMSRGGKDYPKEVAWIANQILTCSDDLHLIIKVHPKESAETYPHLKNIPRLSLVDSSQYPGDNFNVYLLLSSRVAVLYSSTIGFSALALEVPLLTYAFDDFPIGKYYQIIGGNVRVTQRQDFADRLKELLFNDRIRYNLIQEQRRVRENYMRLDGNCCNRIGLVLSSGNIS